MEKKTKDIGAKKIDFGEGKAKETPAPGSPPTRRADSERCYSEHEGFNEGKLTEHAMKISSKDNGGQEAGGSPSGM